jgi:hypothetical protein
MLVVLMKNQLLTPQQICQTCLLADQSGQPRWRQGQLCCGYLIRKLDENQPELYQCQMGFQIVNID